MSVYEAKLIKPFLFVSMMLFATAAATCASISGSGVTLQIVGEIQPGDDQRVKEHLERTREPHVFAFVTSNGGDVRTAMQIGRLLRQHEAQVTTDNCLSSCVLILIGGVERNVYTYSTLSSFAKRARGIGLHRPYFSTVSPSLSSSEIAQKRQKLTAEIAAYLQEMNVSSRLLDLMEAVPPEKMKFLTAAEVSDLGLDAPDPVWDEKDVAARAAAHGVTSSEFRRRRVSVEAICPSAVGTARHSAAQIEESLDCAEAVGWGLGLGEYRSRKQQFEKWLRVTYGAEALGQFRDWSEKDKAPVRNCRIKFMVAGAQACER